MKKSEIKIGGVYVAKVSNKLTRVRVDRIVEYTSAGPYNGWASKDRTKTRYHVTNLTTNRALVFHSATKFRGEPQSEAGRLFVGRLILGQNAVQSS
jgi:hypothetical protein